MLPIPKFYKSISGNDIAFVDGGAGEDTITQVAALFIVAGFQAGDVFNVAGSGANDGAYTIISVVAGTINVVTGSLTAEGAGAAVTIDAEATAIYDFGSVDAGAFKPDATGIEIELWNDKADAGSDTMTDVRISVRDADGEEDEIWTKQCWIEIKSSGVDGTAVDDAMTAYTKVGLNHELCLGDIPKASSRHLFIRIHTPADAEEQNISFQLRVKFQDSATDLIEVIELHFQDLRIAERDYVLAATAGTGAEQEITVGLTNPDYPRNISIFTTNNAAPAGDVIITGINNLGQSVTEDITLGAGATVFGNVAFATVTKVTIPAGVAGGDDVEVGISDKIGLITAIDNIANVYKKKVNNVDASDEIAGNVSKTYHTLDCGVIVLNEDMAIWYIGR